jgi:hypothetical protein
MNIKAKTIIKVLPILFLAFVGLPKATQSNQRSNVMSHLLQKVMHQLN